MARVDDRLALLRPEQGQMVSGGEGGVERGVGRRVGESNRFYRPLFRISTLLEGGEIGGGEGEGEVRLGEEGELEGGGAWEVRFFSWKGIFRDERWVERLGGRGRGEGEGEERG